jgi:RHS repeat-associated protein
VQQTVGTSVTNYLWDEASIYGDVVLETDGNGVPQASYVLGDDELLAQARSGAVSYSLSDGQGSVRLLTDANGAITDSYTYDAYGNLLSSQGATVNPYRYTGQQLDSLTGLYDLRARYYDPTVGRFLSRDTAGIDVSNPVEVNRYSYAEENPVNLTDPSGHAAFAERSLLSFLLTSIVVGAEIGLAAGVVDDFLVALSGILLLFLTLLESKGLAVSVAGSTTSNQKPNWVVRGGLSAPDVLQANYRERLAVPGLFGFSVQYAPGTGLTEDQLAIAGQFPNTQITYAEDTTLLAVATSLGYTAAIIPSPGRGFHATFTVSRGGVVLKQLPDDLAKALSGAFKSKRNPLVP